VGLLPANVVNAGLVVFPLCLVRVYLGQKVMTRMDVGLFRRLAVLLVLASGVSATGDTYRLVEKTGRLHSVSLLVGGGMDICPNQPDAPNTASLGHPSCTTGAIRGRNLL